MKSLKFAFIQSGYCVFGVGYTEQQAISDARKWLESPDGVQGGMTFRAVENLLSRQRIDGGFRTTRTALTPASSGRTLIIHDRLWGKQTWLRHRRRTDAALAPANSARATRTIA